MTRKLADTDHALDPCLIRGIRAGVRQVVLNLGEEVLKRPRHRSANASSEKRAHGEREATKLIAEGKTIAGLTEKELPKLPGSDAKKLAIASVVRERTTVDMKWIAEKLHLRSAANASQRIRRYRQKSHPLLKALHKWMNPSRNVAYLTRMALHQGGLSACLPRSEHWSAIHPSRSSLTS